MAVIVVIHHLYLSDSDDRKRLSRQMRDVWEQWREWGQSLSVYGRSLLCHVLWRTAGTAIGRMEQLFIPAILECGECTTSFCLRCPSHPQSLPPPLRQSPGHAARDSSCTGKGAFSPTPNSHFSPISSGFFDKPCILFNVAVQYNLDEQRQVYRGQTMWRQKSLWPRTCPRAKSRRDATVRNRRQAESNELVFVHSLEETQLLDTPPENVGTK